MDNGFRAAVGRFVRRIAAEDVNLHGFLLSENGREIAKAYYAPFREGEPHRMYSVSKTMTSLAVGIQIDEGRLRLDDRIADYFRDWLPADPDGRLCRLTVRDMLCMATCYKKTVYRAGVDDDWAKAFFEGTPDHEPGMVFCYDTSSSQVLAELVKRLSGRGVLSILEERLFTPLGANDPKYWLKDPSGCEQGGTGLCISLRDLHKVAVCLADGGQGFVPAWYLEEMTRKQIDTSLQPNEEERYGYGLHCWRTRAGWSMFGMGGQLAVVCPEKHAVFSTIADTRLDAFGVQRIYNAFFEEIYPYISPDAEPVALDLAVPPLASAPNAARTSAGPYAFAPENPLSMKEISLTGGFLRWSNAHGEASLPLCPGKVVRTAFPGYPDEPALLSMGWTEFGRLRVRCFAVGNAPCGFDMMIAFSDDAVTVKSYRSENSMTEGYEGVASGYRA